jgi:hypothetical protein
MSASRVRPRESEEFEESGLPEKKQRTTFESSEVSKIMFEVKEFQSTIKSVFSKEVWLTREVIITERTKPKVFGKALTIKPVNVKVKGIAPQTLVNIAKQTWQFKNWADILTFLNDAEYILTELDKNPDSRILDFVDSTVTMIAQKIPELIQLHGNDNESSELTPLEQQFDKRFKELFKEAIEAGIPYLKVNMSHSNYFKGAYFNSGYSPSYTPTSPSYCPTIPSYSPTSPPYCPP